ncbi:HDOD domain-containing protein [Ferrimonas marina]|uniref:HD-like signal output (HDOD) domain, no enzymatic activity n=1 Tax=Ferrimonas marina TaxID=299255 RepID=A0A1M5YGN2_9GAMM|nr:HDOD domain-containing protein [Ferrimonas marina]SHI11018.1 HD-like signal output (HDOD) domain, no enzymatic activity [Ferrimonas marina]
MATERALLLQLIEKIQNNTLVLPTLPEVAMRVRQQCQDPDCPLDQLANTIMQDPALTTRLVALANSAAFGGRVKVDSLALAVKRLGLSKTRELASAVAMHQLFYSEQERTWRWMESLWQQSVEVASCALAVLACLHDQGLQRHLNSDTLLLACLVHNIGALPLLDQWERCPALLPDEQHLSRAIQLLGPQLGKTVLENWDFPEALVEVARHGRDSAYQTPEVSYLDLVRLAAVYSRLWPTSEPLTSQLELFQRKGVLPSLDLFGMDTYFLTYNSVRASLAPQPEEAVA